MSLLISIVNYKTPELVIENLEALAKERDRFSDFFVIIVDNASGPESEELIDKAIQEKGMHSWVELVISKENGGFAAGNNLAIETARKKNRDFDYILLLNPDAKVWPESVKGLVAFMQKHPRVGIVGPAIVDSKGKPTGSAFRFPSLETELLDTCSLGVLKKIPGYTPLVYPPVKNPKSVDWVSGAALMMRSSVLEDTGLMDEKYFLYFEEVDLCFAAKKAGWQIWHNPNYIVQHIEGAATDFQGESNKRRPHYWFDSRARFFEKNYGMIYKFFANLAWVSGYSICFIKKIIKQESQVPFLFRDFLSHWRSQTGL